MTENEPQEPENEPDMFSAAYVAELRAEAAEHRVGAKKMTAFRDAYREASIREAAREILADPADLAWSDEFDGEDGMPDSEKISEAAKAFADAKPHLARARGDVGQGFRGDESDSVDLASLLRAGA